MALLLATSFAVALAVASPQCKRFDKIYASGKELCENMWADAFVYEEDESKAYTMWFFDKTNPNDAMSRHLGLLTDNHSTCHLDYFHKDAPGPEPAGFKECHPWKDNACCSTSTVLSAEKLKTGYGKEYHWDRCGPLSPECERFFVQEACFYECDPNAGLFRKFNSTIYDPKCDKYATGYDKAHATAQNCNHNAWQMHKMPIKASYCNAWLNACASDLFCSAGDGDYFTCAKQYKFVDTNLLAAQRQANETRKQLEAAERERMQQANKSKAAEAENARLQAALDNAGLGVGMLALIIALAVCAACMLGVGAYMVRKEKQGKPVFGKLDEEADKRSQQYQADDNAQGPAIGAQT